MREADGLHFSPKYTFFNLHTALSKNNRELLVKMLRDRVYGFYLRPAKLLSQKGKGFSNGLLCAAAIDFLARMQYPEYEKLFPNDFVKRRIVDWLKTNIQEFNKDIFCIRFYYDFRCGLVHEGRIKPFGEFSFQQNGLIEQKDGVIRINPKILLEKVENAFDNYLIILKKDDGAFKKFKKTLKKDFGPEVKRI